MYTIKQSFAHHCPRQHSGGKAADRGTEKQLRKETVWALRHALTDFGGDADVARAAMPPQRRASTRWPLQLPRLLCLWWLETTAGAATATAGSQAEKRQHLQVEMQRRVTAAEPQLIGGQWWPGALQLLVHENVARGVQHPLFPISRSSGWGRCSPWPRTAPAQSARPSAAG